MKIRDKIRKALYLLGKIDVLPASVINSVNIVENHDEMVDIKEDADFFFSDELKKESSVYLRKTVYDKLKSTELPDGYLFKIMSAYRSLDEQKKRWIAKCAEIRKRYPDISEDELFKKVRVFCADPRKGFGGHQTGGAVDITLCDKNGNEYDMGTAYKDVSPKARTGSDIISSEQYHNRQILYSSLKNSDFANYPSEWWHYSHGDRLWAAYNNLKQCSYGMPGEEEFSKVNLAHKNDIAITFTVPHSEEDKSAPYDKELLLDEIKGSDARDLAEIACDMTWNDTLKLLLKTDKEKQEYEQFISVKSPDLIDRWHEIMAYRQKIIAEAEKVLNKPFAEITSIEKSRLYKIMDKKLIPLQDWHVNFPQMSPDLSKSYDDRRDAFMGSALEYISGAAKRRTGNDQEIRQGFWLAVRDKESGKMLGVMAISTKITAGNLIGHSGRFISPDFQRKKIGVSAGFVMIDFMYKYLMDKEQPQIYQGAEAPLFDSTCHPFNSASRGLQGRNGAVFLGYDSKKQRFKYGTTREQHEQTLDGLPPIEWTARYKGMDISSKTGTQHKLSIQDEAKKFDLIKNNIDKTNNKE